MEAKGAFKDKVVLVTGAGRGMGRATALVFAAEGAKLVVNDLSLEGAESVVREIEEMGQEAIAVQADVSDFGQVSRMVDMVLKRFGTIDILVNNAGIQGQVSLLEEIDESNWDLVIGVNLKGVFNCTQAVLPIMKAKRSGKIINISSLAGRSASFFGGAHYTASKAGVLGLTRHTAREVAPYNINANAIAPGRMPRMPGERSVTSERWAEFVRSVPLGREGAYEDVANLVLFLASDRASYITGATIDINGGLLMI